MDLVPIGRFARQSGLTVKALRHYDTLGLLTPARVDPVTRHRWYAAGQLDTARRIRRLRALELPLAEVRAVLAAPDGGRERLLAYRRDVEARLARDQRILHGLVHLIEGDDDMTATETTAPTERQLASDLFNLVWTLLEQAGRTTEDDDRMLHAAHASRYHWGQVGGPEQLAIGEWQCARVYSVLGRASPRCTTPGAAWRSRPPGTYRTGWSPRLTRGWPGPTWSPATAGPRWTNAALARGVLEHVGDAEDRQIVEDDLASLPL